MQRTWVPLKGPPNDLDDTRNRSLKKNLIFQNITQESLRESWETTKRIVANEIHRVIPHRSLGKIATKTEWAHWPKENQSSVSQHNRIPPIITKSTEWAFTEEIKMSFIKFIKESKEQPYSLYLSNIQAFLATTYSYS